MGFSSPPHFLDRARRDCRSSTQALRGQSTASLLELHDADVVEARFPAAVTYVSGRVDVSSLWYANPWRQESDGNGGVGRRHEGSGSSWFDSHSFRARDNRRRRRIIKLRQNRLNANMRTCCLYVAATNSVARRQSRCSLSGPGSKSPRRDSIRNVEHR